MVSMISWRIATSAILRDLVSGLLAMHFLNTENGYHEASQAVLLLLLQGL